MHPRTSSLCTWTRFGANCAPGCPFCPCSPASLLFKLEFCTVCGAPGDSRHDLCLWAGALQGHPRWRQCPSWPRVEGPSRLCWQAPNQHACMHPSARRLSCHRLRVGYAPRVDPKPMHACLPHCFWMGYLGGPQAGVTPPQCRGHPACMHASPAGLVARRAYLPGPVIHQHACMHPCRVQLPNSLVPLTVRAHLLSGATWHACMHPCVPGGTATWPSRGPGGALS